ncbi:hypothetical protein RQP46_005075 [Phenoliferia psychrophenolica]
MSAAKKEKVVSVKGDEASEIRQVLAYLNSQNRPYGATDLSANLKNRVTKAQAAKTLALLHEKGEIMGKAYGKTSVYCALQKDVDTLGPEEMEQLESTISALRSEEKDIKDELKKLAAQKALLVAQPKTTDLSDDINAAVQRSATLASHLSSLRPSSSPSTTSPPLSISPITSDSLTALNLSHKTTLSTLLSRRKVVKEIEGVLLDQFEKRKGAEAEIWELVGGDPDVGDWDRKVMSCVEEIGTA